MRAIVYDPGAPHGLRLGMALDPVPGAHEALVEVHAIALNFGEVAFLAERCKPGQVIGWECAGVVLEAAADGSGPPAGARVAGFGSSGGWAERRAMSVDELAMVPDAIELGAAAAVPVAGVTALRALRALGPVAGRRVERAERLVGRHDRVREGRPVEVDSTYQTWAISEDGEAESARRKESRCADGRWARIRQELMSAPAPRLPREGSVGTGGLRLSMLGSSRRAAHVCV